MLLNILYLKLSTNTPHIPNNFLLTASIHMFHMFLNTFPLSFTAVYLHFSILFMLHFDFPPAISIITSVTFSTISHFESVTKSLKIEISKQFQSTSEEHLLIFWVEKNVI